MKPFDLEAAQRGEPIQTRDGRPVVFGGHNPKAPKQHRIVGWVEDDTLASRDWDENGCWEAGVKHKLDLFMTSKKYHQEVWQNWYLTKPGGLVVVDNTIGYETKEHADLHASKDRVACTMTVVEWEE